MAKAKIGIVGYGTIGERCADGVAQQDDMDLVGVADIAPSLPVRALQESGRDVLLADFSASDRFDVTDQLERVRQPTVIIVGSHDQVTPPRYSEDMAEHIPDSRLVKIEGAGHMVMLQRPDETAREVRQLLDQISAG